MAMFGGMAKMPGYGFGQFSPPLVEDQTEDLSRRPSMFGGMSAGAGMAPVKPAALAGFTPYRPGLLDKAGLIGDILSGGQVGQQMLAQKQGQAALAYSAAHPAPLIVGAKAFDPVTHQVIADGTKEPEPSSFERELAMAGIQPGSPDYARLTRSKAEADAAGTPFVYEQYNPVTKTTDKVITSRGALGGGMPSAPAGPPAAAIDHLRTNPQLATAFDAKYGAGASRQYLGGGAAPQAPAPFRP